MNPWQVTRKNDVRGRVLADRHYTRGKPGHPMWTRPGYNFVLYSEDDTGGAVFVWWRPKWEAGQERFDGLRALECTIFRNESGALSSDLIKHACSMLASEEAADALKLERGILVATALGRHDGLRLISGVSTAKTSRRRSKRHAPGHCFRVAGWRPFDHKIGRADVWLERPRIV